MFLQPTANSSVLGRKKHQTSELFTFFNLLEFNYVSHTVPYCLLSSQESFTGAFVLRLSIALLYICCPLVVFIVHQMFRLFTLNHSRSKQDSPHREESEQWVSWAFSFSNSWQRNYTTHNPFLKFLLCVKGFQDPNADTTGRTETKRKREIEAGIIGLRWNPSVWDRLSRRQENKAKLGLEQPTATQHMWRPN